MSEFRRCGDVLMDALMRPAFVEVANIPSQDTPQVDCAKDQDNVIE